MINKKFLRGATSVLLRNEGRKYLNYFLRHLFNDHSDTGHQEIEHQSNSYNETKCSQKHTQKFNKIYVLYRY